MGRFIGDSRVAAITVAVSLWTVPAVAQDAEAIRLPEILRVIPADAPAVVIIPHLKARNDDITRLLEGMDRANLLLGSRPIDQLKSISGFNAAVDDNGAAAMVITNVQAWPPRVAWLMPVSDAKAFLESNFTGRAADGEGYLRSDGSTVYARPLDAFVLMSSDAATVRDFVSGDGLLAPLSASLHGRTIPDLQWADGVIMLRKPMLAMLRQRALGEAADQGLRLPGIAVLAAQLTNDVDTLFLTIQGDPLALIVRGAATFDSASTFGSKAAAQPSTDAGLARLPAPSSPAALAMSIDFAAIGGATTLRDIAKSAGMADAPIPAWLDLVTSMQFVITPSAAGAKGGLLNGAAVVFGSATPAKVRDEIRLSVQSAADAKPLVSAAKWSDAQTLPDGTTADQYEMRSIDPPADLAAVEALLFGTAGLRGYVRTLSDCIVVTFAQRAGLLAEVATAAQAAIQTPASGFAASPAVKVMRQWMHGQRDVEVYLGLQPWMVMLSDLGVALPLHGLQLPEFDVSAPPIGMAFDVSPQRIDGAVIVPASLLAPALDEFMRFKPMQPVEPAPN